MVDSSLTTYNTDQQQNLALLKVYTVYRVSLCIALLVTFFLTPDNPLIGSLHPSLFVYVTVAYLLVNLITLLVVIPKNTPQDSKKLFSNFVFDIIAITLIVDTTGGTGSGLGILLVVIIAASSIILRGQIAILTAAIASIAIIGDTARLVSDQHLAVSDFLPAGLLGLILFITAFFIQNLAERIRGVQLVAEQRALDVSKLQLLNEQIVQRMRTGILVADQQGRIHMTNEAASELLADINLQKAYQHGELPELSPNLMQEFSKWQVSPQYHTPPFRATEAGPELHVSFSPLTNEKNTDILVFLENNRQLVMRAQQMKLASLGRLTASIAHEIRNPLGAISHAAQLLNESDQLSKADLRLCEIVQDHSNRMNKVIENVLQLSRRGAPNPETIDLNFWLRQFINEFGSTHDDYYEIDLITEDVQCEVTIDTSQLSQVITNLAENGLRYSEQTTGRPSLAFESHINPATQLPILDIIDDGAGIDEESREKLFEPFYTTEAKGTGLGLYISSELCEANEARLDYIRTDEGKSCFRISFPHPHRRLTPE